ncbi:hypothetical protein SAMN04487969_119135 [Paenibacillus algorifonticola]|uniref:CHAT domain-containing protein n=1 Tax=Paenibacillus algorifonticola TaxID=684063 RepID=A0A1I2H2N9_9BACL|nr:hypothetical protein [Paenibacillus algorifonticola]SFF23952.1 hypothetical protein SAMN04487969_119135 [Paenibacillus algorifonticola]
MNIVFYRSFDEKIKRNSAFTERLEKKLAVNHFVEMAIDDDRMYNLRKVKEADIIFIFSHGYYHATFHKFANDYDVEIHRKEIFIGKEHLDYFKNKKVLVFACYTAMEGLDSLGEKAVENGCKVYFGFSDRINRDIPEALLDCLSQEEKQAHVFISDVYSKVFYDVIERAFKRDLTFDQFAKQMKYYLNKEIGERIINRLGGVQNFRILTDGAISVKQTADSITVLGDKDLRFIS